MLVARSLFAVLALVSAATFLPQGGIPPGQYDLVFESWVDPVLGLDSPGEVNNPDLPFKTLQKAIDATFTALSADHAANPTLNRRGIVYALPGIYGPAGVASNPADASGDEFPIKMRDRVSVKGIGARRCVLRGIGVPGANAPTVFWPDQPSGGAVSISTPVEVLLDLSTGYPGIPPHPSWWDFHYPWQDTLEAFDGFVFEGGDVQVLASTSGTVPYTYSSMVSNCVFDMRHGWQVDPSSTSTVAGPWFGVHMPKAIKPGGAGFGLGYVDARILLANNTFVMARYVGGGNWESCRSGAVGVIDVTDPSCNLFQRDCDDSLRGVGNPGLMNNVFRTPPASVQAQMTWPTFAMLGIDSTDTRVSRDAADTQGVETNAFASALVGATNTRFWSTPMVTGIVNPANSQEPDHWDCGGSTLVVQWSLFPCCPITTQPACPCPGPCTCPNAHTCVPAPLPVPAVSIYYSLPSERDPGFVGEYLANIAQPPAPQYVDWRLLPQSPLKDMGLLPAGDPRRIEFANGSMWEMEELPFDPFQWDGEGYGNPRAVDGTIDIGADELHFFTMAASWANDSHSHNERGRLDGTGPAGTSKRRVIVAQSAGGQLVVVGRVVRINGKAQDTPAAPTIPTGWIQPPATLANPAVGAVPPYPIGYETKYIAFNNSGPPQPPTPWAHTIVQQDFISYQPLNGAVQQPMQFVLFTVDDDECSPAPCTHSYFNAQAVLQDSLGTELLRSNLQAEYR